MDSLKEITLAGNELWRIVLFFASVLVSLIAGRLARFALEKSAGKSGENQPGWLPVLLTSIAKPAVVVAFAIGLRLGLSALNLSESAREIADTVSRVLASVAAGYAVYSLANVVDYHLARFSAKTKSRVDDMLVPLVGKTIRITILVMVLLQIAQSLSDKPITSILAGLGVGGLAVALAGQDTIKNFFGSLVIIADKPFEIGDRVVIDGYDGPVEKVGFRSTRIRTLEGNLVTVPNGELVNKTVENIGKRPHIRHLANITITYDTPPEKVERAVNIIREILDNHEGMHPDYPPRAFFSGFNDCSLNILMLYWYRPPDYWQYQAFSEKVNMEILKRFNEEGIEFAFPTQTLYLAGDDKRELALKVLRDDD